MNIHSPFFQKSAQFSFPSCVVPITDQTMTTDSALYEPKPFKGIVGAAAGQAQAYGVIQRDPNIYVRSDFFTEVFAGIHAAVSALKQSPSETLLIGLDIGTSLVKGCAIPVIGSAIHLSPLHVKLALGFPVSHLSRGTEVRKLLFNDGDTWTIRKGNESFQVKIEEVAFRSQPSLMITDQIFLHNGSFSDKRGAELLQHGNLVGVNIGSNTIETACRTMQGVTAEKCFPGGLFEVLPAVESALYKQTGAMPTELETLTAMRTGIWQAGQQQVNVRAAIDEVLTTYLSTSTVCRTLNTYLQSIPSKGTLLLGGGGAHVAQPIMDAFQTSFTHGAMVAQDDAGKPEPEFSVARGLLKLLMYLEVKHGQKNV